MGEHDARDEHGGAGPLEPALAEMHARLAADIAAVDGAVAGLDQAQSDWRPAPESWSVGEILHHLILSNRLFALAVRRLVQRGRREGVLAAAASRRSWPRLRSIADSAVSGPVKNPAAATPTRGLPIAELRRDLDAAHAVVQDLVPALAGLDLGSLRLPHPLGFELNLYQWVDTAGAHERRHLAQIEAVKAAAGFPHE